jgi:hypothetical protein
MELSATAVDVVIDTTAVDTLFISNLSPTCKVDVSGSATTKPVVLPVKNWFRGELVVKVFVVELVTVVSYAIVGPAGPCGPVAPVAPVSPRGIVKASD